MCESNKLPHKKQQKKIYFSWTVANKSRIVDTSSQPFATPCVNQAALPTVLCPHDVVLAPANQCTTCADAPGADRVDALIASAGEARTRKLEASAISGARLVQQPPHAHETIADEVELPEATHVRMVLVMADLQRAGQRRQPCVSIKL